jgi:hypothetical protein
MAFKRISLEELVETKGRNLTFSEKKKNTPGRL